MMNVSALLKNQKGTTLIEALVAIAVLTIGVLAALGMQTRAIGDSAAALKRTDANNMAISLLETLKGLPFDDPNLVQTSATLVELNGVNNIFTAQQLTTLINAAKVRTYVVGSLPSMSSLIFRAFPMVGISFGTIVDRSDISYQLAWDVKDTLVPTDLTKTLHKTIRVFMTWNSPMGPSKLEMTTVKYNNINL